MKEIDFKSILNPSQYQAVTTTQGPLLVVAGAGTGKTRVIEYRVLNLILSGVKPSSILLLTFTRKAAREMLDRASGHNKLCQQVEGGTFHSFAYKLIKKFRKHLGFQNNISFLDEADSADALHLLATRLGFLDRKLRFPKKDTLRSIISMSINRSQNINSVLEKDYPHFLDLRKDMEELHKAYIDYKINHSVIDYDDMLLYSKFLLEKDAILKEVSSRFTYIMVDEFQDTNKLQAEIVYLLGKIHGNVMVVGDDTQSIYSFRGAYYKNMFDFPKKFTNCKILKLEHNYRSTQPILDVANAVIEGEKEKYTKVLFTVNKNGTKPELNFFKDAQKEADFIAHKIKELYDQGIGLSSMGVLYRSNYNSLPLQLSLSRMDIPFIVYGGIRFIETAHVKDVLSFMKVLQNRDDELAWNRILTMLDGIGPRTAEKIYQSITSKRSLDAAFKEFLPEHKIKPELNRLLKLFQKIKSKELDICEELDLIRDFYFPIMKKKFDDYHVRNDDLRALIQISSEYKTREEFLVDFVALEAPEKSLVGISRKNMDEQPVVLSTIHSAKGLEWEAVFIISLMEGNLPVSYSMEDPESIEEERRLLYVAVTRAKSKLFLSMHNQGQDGGIFSFNRLSRFINEKKVLNRLLIDYNKFEKLEDGYDDFKEIDVNEDEAKVLRKLYDYFEY
ncbi:MAG: ATP-dependent helicase [Candidatus Omnitrophica bacterium]|nr:ATP-dependent helicase [Candidatus Omnitrophota bacterium]MDD5352517.1 ATP-dependent helicase [Candidatus Omnitrophota bacterium]MDD5550115.1 ATP-dependent helicase [Candidatus Omnitrophota bacterium]